MSGSLWIDAATSDAETTKEANEGLMDHVQANLPRYRAFTEEMAEMPYTTEAAAIVTYRMWVEISEAEFADQETIDALDAETDGGLGRMVALFGYADRGGRVRRDFQRVIDALRPGAKSDMCEAMELDRFGQPNIAQYMAGCRQSVSVAVEDLDKIDLETFIAPWHGTAPVDAVFFKSEDENLTYDVDGTPWVIRPYDLLWSWDQYRVICNLCASGYEWVVQSTVAPKQKRPRKTKNMTTKHVVMPNDAITNAFFGRDENTVQPWDYFDHDRPETALAISTGGGGKANVIIVRNDNTTIDAAIETYRLTPEDRFWLEAVCSLARDGQGVIRGSDILKFNGYKNPYQKTAKDVMSRAYHSVRKMWRMHIAIDTTNEKKNRYSRLMESYDEQSLVDCNWSVMKFEDDTTDFEITLNTTHDGTPLGALPLAVYAADKGQLLMAKRDDFEFETIGRLTMDHRLMWRYVLRRIKDRTTSTTIVFDTIFKNIGLEDVDRKKRAKMLTILHNMLEERQRQGALAFAWNRDKNGRSEYSVTITPAK